jgi:formylglycine-generating enzyme required for sulfatase activity
LVTITKAFYIGESNINCEQLKTFLKNINKELRNKYVNAAVSNQFRQFDFCDDEIRILCPATDPVGTISWEGAVAYCQWLSHLSKMNFRLPAEAEWEFAARGNRNKYDSVWEHIRYPNPSPVTPAGVCDMATGFLGNWCSDFFDNYTSISKLNPKGPSASPKKYNGNSEEVRVIRRPFSSIVRREFGNVATNDGGIYGFRVVLDEEYLCPCPGILESDQKTETGVEK